VAVWFGVGLGCHHCVVRRLFLGPEGCHAASHQGDVVHACGDKGIRSTKDAQLVFDVTGDHHVATN